MNSNSKHQDNQQDKASEIDKISGASAIMAAKIAYQIRSYSFRLCSANFRLKELNDYSVVMREEGFDRLMLRQEIKNLKEEIRFCEIQVRAYQENDNKAKIIPDRLL
jgi:hypothetical protein